MNIFLFVSKMQIAEMKLTTEKEHVITVIRFNAALLRSPFAAYNDIPPPILLCCALLCSRLPLTIEWNILLYM